MRRKSFALAIAGGIAVAPSFAAAQVRPQVSPLVTSDRCERYDQFTPKQALNRDGTTQDADEAAATLAACLLELDAAIERLAAKGAAQPSSEPTAPRASSAAAQADQNRARAAGITAGEDQLKSTSATADTLEEQLHLAFVKAYLSFRNLQRWQELVKGDGSTGPPRDHVLREFSATAERLQTALAQHGLTQPFSASLVTAFSLNSSGSTASSAATSGGSSAHSTDAAGFVSWESIHFYAAPDRSWDVNLSGTFGFQPVLALVQPATATSPAEASTSYQQAFVWSVSAQPNWRFADLAELTAFGRVGQSILNSTNTINENVTPAVVEVAASNGTGRAEMFAEAGARIAIYGQSLEILHMKRGLLNPMFAFAAGFRRDNRFTGSGPLAAVNAPEQRLFLRVQIDGLQLENRKQADRPFTVGVSVDFDTALHRAGTFVPSGTRILIRGDLNLFKAAQSDK